MQRPGWILGSPIDRQREDRLARAFLEAIFEAEQANSTQAASELRPLRNTTRAVTTTSASSTTRE